MFKIKEGETSALYIAGAVSAAVLSTPVALKPVEAQDKLPALSCSQIVALEGPGKIKGISIKDGEEITGALITQELMTPNGIFDKAILRISSDPSSNTTETAAEIRINQVTRRAVLFDVNGAQELQGKPQEIALSFDGKRELMSLFYSGTVKYPDDKAQLQTLQRCPQKVTVTFADFNLPPKNTSFARSGEPKIQPSMKVSGGDGGTIAPRP